MRILGISALYHDSAAALIDDGIPIAMAQEERFTRIKHDASFPKNAIDYCLRDGKAKEIDYVVFYEKPFLKFERFILSNLSFFPHTRNQFRIGMLSWFKQKMWIKSQISDYLNIEDEKILFIPHHLSHAAASFYPSPFDEAAIITVDGVGEYTTTAVGYGCGTDIKFSRKIQFPHSIGLLYSTFTGYLGFQVNDGEYKVMGLAPYGKPSYTDKISKIIDIKNDGSFRLNLDYFSYHKSSEHPYNEKFLNLFGQPRDKKMGHQFTQRHADIAASVQKITEDILIKLSNYISHETKSKNLCIAGGVGLNSVANYKILKSSKFENIFIQPASGDAGGALGAALFVHHALLKNPRKFVMKHSYYGWKY
jgi:carbamoyltransferase